ncbi:MAG: hypothetical protein VXW70_04055, partial [Candidatus Thermoplasmatota archaeon]|nr:hypothetical protein [Candidatus Thermoplasmatota archaeon]
GKRRWIGIIIPKKISTKGELIEYLEKLSAADEISRIPRLIEFNLGNLSDGRSTGIIEVKLEDYEIFRRLLRNDDLNHEGKMISFTASGKITLVRERMLHVN